MRKNRVFTFFLLALIAFTSCREEQKQAPSSYPTMTVKKESRNLDSRYSAAIRGRQDIEIYPQVGGTLQQLLVIEGQRVSKGQVLFVIDQVPYRVALNTAEADVKTAQSALATARITYEGRQRLLEQKVISDFDMQKAANELASAEAAVEQAKARLANARNDLSYTVVRSPADGVVGTLPYRQGALVGSTMEQPLTVVSDNSSMYVYFSMDENSLLDMLQQYGSVEKALAQMPDVQLQLSNGSIYNHTGRVESISGVISQTTGTVSLRAIFANPDRLLHSGANGSILFPEHYDNVITIPQESTFELQDKVLVYKVVDGVTRSTQITVSPINDGRKYIVTGGLEVGDQIIAAGAGLLKEGMHVKAAATASAPEQSVASAAGVTEKSNENVKSEE